MREHLSRDRESAALLAWYDRHARALPWRVPPGAAMWADPYRVWLSEIMLQQTTVAAVVPYFEAFLARWPDVRALAAAPLPDLLAAWAGLGYYARARNLHACARVVAARGGFPDTEAGLRALPGIGPYTAAAIAAIAFGRRAVVVDGNVERVIARRFAVETPLPDAKPELRRLADLLTPEARPGDYAQAAMDLGATICTPRRPACGLCPWMEGCEGRRRGIAEALPAKRPKAAKPVRHGTAWAGFDAAGRVLTLHRPATGLLGGMLALPSAGWDGSEGQPPAADWEEAGEVRHTFTHFHLRLGVLRARLDGAPGPWLPVEAAIGAMPTVFAKALRLAAAPWFSVNALSAR